MIKKLKLVLVIVVSFLFTGISFANECKECVEVAKGLIPPKFLDKNIKELPSGIKIWDSPEAIDAINDGTKKILWVDTRPKSFFVNGTVKNAVNIFYDQKVNPIPDSEKDIEFTIDRIKSEMTKIDPVIGNVLLVIFCQGPECHRSYNACFRCIGEFGIPISQVIWFRDGYPGLLSHIEGDPKLKKRISKYFQGKVVTE